MLPAVADAYVKAQTVALDFEYFSEQVIRP
jgi:hypothetical protein